MRPPVGDGRIEPMGNEYFYEAAFCQVHFPFQTCKGFLLQWSIELAASLNVRLLSASNELLSLPDTR